MPSFCIGPTGIVAYSTMDKKLISAGQVGNFSSLNLLALYAATIMSTISSRFVNSCSASIRRGSVSSQFSPNRAGTSVNGCSDTFVVLTVFVTILDNYALFLKSILTEDQGLCPTFYSGYVALEVVT